MTSPFLSPSRPTCPPDLLATAQSWRTPLVAIAAAQSGPAMQAAQQATGLGLMRPVFVGDQREIHRLAAAQNWDISAYPVIEAKDDATAARLAARACAQGSADILMKGGLNSDLFLKNALRRDSGLITRTRPVHIFHITAPGGGRPLLISDCALNVSPTMRTRKIATRKIVSLLHKLGNPRPRIAMLSATETPISAIPSSIEARELRDWARETIDNAEFSGPLALDLILSRTAALIKGVAAGEAHGPFDGVIVPDIVSGNVLFKALVYLAGGCAAGLITGARVPLILTSRADPPAARLASIALATISGAEKKAPT